VISSVAYLSMHTSPLHQPGQGDAGGMNVYMHELACTMAARGISVVVFTRRCSADDPAVVTVAPGYDVVHVGAGPPAHLPVAALPDHVSAFTEGVLDWTYGRETSYDVVHSHYWLSGWSGVLVKEALGVPLANSFHTLGRVKDVNRRPDEAASSPLRTLTEEEVIARSDCVIASTPYEFEDLLDHYGASPERLCTSPPGVDHTLFKEGDQTEARRWLGLGDEPMVLFAGRIQALKGIDIAVRAVAGIDVAHLAVVGGPSGQAGREELAALHHLAADLGVRDRVHFLAPLPHDQLAEFYRAADVLVMPSRSESFGLVAAEAQACGLPVVAARVGGLPYVIDDEVSGLLVDGHEPDGYTKALRRVLEDSGFASRLRRGALRKAEEFSWPATADRLIELYSGITGK
jgi:D-inositol-3-phosphate glycosyltransferase